MADKKGQMTVLILAEQLVSKTAALTASKKVSYWADCSVRKMVEMLVQQMAVLKVVD